MALAESSTQSRLPTVAFLLAIAFWPGIAGAATTPRWALLSLGVPALLLTVKDWPGKGAGWGALFLGWAALSLLWTPIGYDGSYALWKFELLAGAFCLGAAADDLRPVYLGLALGIGLSGFLAVAQIFGWSPVHEAASPAGLFINRNYLGEIGALAFIGAVLSRLWWLVPGTFLATCLPASRGALLGLGAAFLAWLWPRSRTAFYGALAGLLAIGVFGANLRPASVADRLAIWSDTLEAVTPWGHGVGSFYSEFPAHAPRTDTTQARPEHAHNDGLEVLFELGPLGILLLGTLLVQAFRGSGETERLILIGFLVMGCFSSPLYFPATGFVAALVAGRLCGARVPQRQSFADGGVAGEPGIFGRAFLRWRDNEA